MKAYINWSGGKDCMQALHNLQGNEQQPELMLCTIGTETQRVSMHGVQKHLIEKQAIALGLELKVVELPASTTTDLYTMIMHDAIQSLKIQGFTKAVFGDIFLEDLKAYRDENLKKVQIEGIYPLWKIDSLTLAKRFISLGYKAIIVCANAQLFPEDIVGKIFDNEFLQKLPKDVDPCGENGEFHTFVFDGPLFTKPIDFELGKPTKKCYPPINNQSGEVCFWYIDLH